MRNPHEDPEATYDKVAVCIGACSDARPIPGTSLVVLRLEPARLIEMRDAIESSLEWWAEAPSLTGTRFSGLGDYFEFLAPTGGMFWSEDHPDAAWRTIIRLIDEAEGVARGGFARERVSPDAGLLADCYNADGSGWAVLPASLFPEGAGWPRIPTEESRLEVTTGEEDSEAAMWAARIRHSTVETLSASFGLRDLATWIKASRPKPGTP